MKKTICLLPIALAATLSLAACGKHDDTTVNTTTTEEVTNEEVVPAGEFGDVNGAAEGNFGDANVSLPADDIATNNAVTLGNGG